MKNTLLFCVVVFTCWCHLQAQVNIDSAKATIRRAKADTNAVKSLLFVAQAYSNKNPDSSLLYATRALELANQIKLLRFTIPALQYKAYSHYLKGNYQQSLSDYKSLYVAAEKQHDKKNMAIAINNEGNVLIELAELDAAIAKYKDAMAISEEIHDEMGIAKAYNNIGYVYKEMGDYERATEHLLKALSVFEKLKLPRETANTYNTIAAIYARQRNFDKALEYDGLALGIQTRNNLLSGMGVSLQDIANSLAEKKEYAKAIATYNSALPIYMQMNDTRQMAILFANVGNVYNLTSQFDSSEYYYDKAIAINRQTGNWRNLTAALTGNAATLISAGKTQKAKKLLDSTQALIAVGNRKQEIKEYYKVLSDYYAATGDDATALQLYKRFILKKDSLLNEQTVQSIADMNIRYQTDKKQLQIELLAKDNSIKDLEINNQKLDLAKKAVELARQQLALSNAKLTIANDALQLDSKNQLLLRKQLDSVQTGHRLQQLNEQAAIQKLALQNATLLNTQKNTAIGFILGVILLLSVLVYLFYQRYQLRQRQHLQTVILQQQESATKAILQAEESERKRIASDLHDGVGQMMSAAKMNLSAIENEMRLTDPRHKEAVVRVLELIDQSLAEVRSVSHSMMPNALSREGLSAALRRFIDQVDKRILKIELHTEGLNEKIDQAIENVLYRIIQECISNVIKHAQASRVDISVIRSRHAIEATIEDDGKGFDSTNTHSYHGIGLKNIRSRIDFLKGTIEWNSSQGRGTLVSFHVPL